MISNAWFVACLIFGGIAGGGVIVLIRLLSPGPAAIGPALRRLHPAAPAAAMTVAPPAQLLLPIRPPMADLAIINRTTGRYWLGLGLSALATMLLPPFIAAALTLSGYSLPIYLPLGLTLVAAALGALLAHADTITKARAARAEFVSTLRAYARLTQSLVRSGHGVVEAMDHAGTIGNGWVWARIRHTLLAAQLQMRSPWEALQELADEIGVEELGRFAAVMAAAGNEGVGIYDTLRAQVTSLTVQERARTLSTIKNHTQQLQIPATLLVFVVVALPGYPLLASLMS